MTLKATGWGLLFVIVKERLTRILKGPGERNLEDYKLFDEIQKILRKPRALLGLRETDILV